MFRKLPLQLLLPLRSVVRLHLLSHSPALSQSEDVNYMSRNIVEPREGTSFTKASEILLVLQCVSPYRHVDE